MICSIHTQPSKEIDDFAQTEWRKVNNEPTLDQYRREDYFSSSSATKKKDQKEDLLSLLDQARSQVQGKHEELLDIMDLAQAQLEAEIARSKPVVKEIKTLKTYGGMLDVDKQRDENKVKLDRIIELETYEKKREASTTTTSTDAVMKEERRGGNGNNDDDDDKSFTISRRDVVRNTGNQHQDGGETFAHGGSKITSLSASSEKEQEKKRGKYHQEEKEEEKEDNSVDKGQKEKYLKYLRQKEKRARLKGQHDGDDDSQSGMRLKGQMHPFESESYPKEGVTYICLQWTTHIYILMYIYIYVCM
jgi:hypothetical protein